eukprot:TRINITY_DN8463_c0_g1::TRINITY_DN8463_c0_g1_i1::g.3381::m.3381 TRINITY_DN8463_c0_g1::TRINITY_DN8463_c0_g1_i1::g.3381  ORF type:complete len:387 (+),score=62.91,sp/Q84MD8/FHYRK_ARATH/32.90/5e-64,Flavokinase/PF01687.12/1.7e-34,HAD_2/PF13419.1/1e-07,DUF1349/PF07081.6/0.12 TRINITY_DN8463_c0_g1_i1:39-1199(+)
MKAIIFHLSGLLVDTDRSRLSVFREEFSKYAESDRFSEFLLPSKSDENALRTVVEALNVPESSSDLWKTIQPKLATKYKETRMMCGAVRLLNFLNQSQIAVGLVCCSPMEEMKTKLRPHENLVSLVDVFVPANEAAPFPSGGIFTHCAKKLDLPLSECAVVTSFPEAVQGALSLNLRVIAVGTALSQSQFSAFQDNPLFTFVPSLLELDFGTLNLGIPSPKDLILGTVPLDPMMRIRGPVIHGFGRGSKILGIPTANLDADVHFTEISPFPCGIYCGWARVTDANGTIGTADPTAPGIFKMVMSVGWNPFFKNQKKTIEPYIMHDFGRDFYDATLAIVVVAFLRPEKNFAGLDALKDAINGDIQLADKALDMHPFAQLATDPFFFQ